MAIFDNGQAPITQSAKTEEANVPRSAFNMSRVNNASGIFGALMPIDVLETLPNEDYNISYDVMALTRNPLVRRLQNGINIYVHTYWSPKRELWKGWDTYITKGRDGKTKLTVPKLLYDWNSEAGVTWNLSGDIFPNEVYSTLTPLAPSTYMGVPCAYYDTNVDGIRCYKPIKWTQNEPANKKMINIAYGQTNLDKTKWGVNALPFVMYNKVCRDYYFNKNLMNENQSWFPLIDEDFCLPMLSPTPNNPENYVSDMKGNAYITKNTTRDNWSQTDDSSLYVPPYNTDDLSIALNMMHFRQFQGDYFTTANPFADLLRGDINETNVAVSGTVDGQSVIDALLPSMTDQGGVYNPTYLAGFGGYKTDGTYDGDYLTLAKLDPSDYQTVGSANKWTEVRGIDSQGLSTAITLSVKNAINKIKLNVTPFKLDALRKAVVIEKFMQRNGTTDGTYASIIQAQFGYRPNVKDNKPRYIGGTKMPIVFNDVVQTSQTSSTEYLGKTASKGIGASSGNIGKFHSDDYGYLMTIMSIVPDVYYENQGLDTMWTRTEQDREYFPILNNLEPQPILNKELYISGRPANDNGLFGYAERFMDMKQRRNIITGFGALGNNALYDKAQFMTRAFSRKQNLNNKFVSMTPNNIDMQPFQNMTEPPFDLMIGCNIDKVSPMPYSAKPADMGIKY